MSTRSRLWACAVVFFFVLVTTLVGASPLASTTVVATPATSAPTSPPVQVCGNASLLDGPATPPPGAVRVDPGQNLNDVTTANPAGTTFWLAPGTHTLAASEFGQVVPKEGDTYVGAPGAILDGMGINRYAFTQKAANVTVRYLTVQNFVAPGDEGVVNHDYGDGWVIEHNTIQSNGGAGAFVGTNGRLSYNCLADNSQYGFQGFGSNLTVDHNEVARNNTYDYETKQPGCGCSGGSKFWSVRGATITANYVHDNYYAGLWADTNNVGFLFEGNYISGNRAAGIIYETSYNFRIVNNTFVRNAIPEGQDYQSRGDPFPIGAIYVSESGGDARVNGGVYATSEISGNAFTDNWAGVVLWENADRFGDDASANTSKGYTTLAVDPSGAYQSPLMYHCGDPASGGTINVAPYTSDCRWKTQNVSVTNNDFSLDKTAIGCTTNLCGQQAVFSNGGTVPSWSPYLGNIVKDNITYTQNNHFTNNRYVGDWHFTAYDTSARLSLAQWQSAPYNQDAGSTISGGPTTTTPTTTPTTVAPTTTTTTVATAGTNLALNRPVVASSIFGTGYEAVRAVDGDGTTRWASAPSGNPEWIYVDLGTAKTFTHVVLTWDPSYAQSYKIQTSNDASTWTDVYSTTTGDGGTDTIPVTATGRYVRMYGLTGALTLFSIWEFQVLG